MVIAAQSVWQQARQAVVGLFEPAAAATPDRWADRPLTILRRTGAKVAVADASGTIETIDLPFGAVATLDAFLAAEGRADAGLTLVREPFSLEGLAFWRWSVRA